jgi:hypothetical protein
MKQLNHPQDAKITPELAREVCLKTNSNAVVGSSIADVGNHFRILLTAIDCRSGKTFARSLQDVTLRNEIVHALGLAGTQLRSRMGEPDASVKEFSKPLELATSSSLEALQSLAQGFKHHSSLDRTIPISYYERAIDIDPSFALAYASVGTVYLGQGRVAEAAAAEKKAYDLRDRLTGQLKFLSETLYYSISTQDLERARPIYEEWVRTFPLDGIGHRNFGIALRSLGEYQRSARESREAIHLMPLLAIYGYYDLMASNIALNQLEEAKNVFREAQAHKYDDASLRSLRHKIAFLEHDRPAMAEQITWAREHAGVGDGVLQGEVSVQAYYGRFHEARRLLRQGQELSAKGRSSFQFGSATWDLALQESEAGNIAATNQLLRTIAAREQGQDLQLALALAFARNGSVKQAKELVDRIDREAPSATLVQFYCLPTIRAAIKLQENDPAGAIELLRPAEKYEFAYPTAFNSVYPAYIRGLAYLQLKNGALAATEFQKVLDHPGIVARFITGALSRVQLGRAQAMMGDKVAARKSYQDFLNLWKGADPDTSIYRMAKAEYAKLL